MTQPAADWSAFPHGYSLLLNEKAQFPHDLANWRLEIDTSRQLFVDTHLIAAITGLERRLHPAVKHDANPLIRDFWAAYLHPQPEGGYLMYGNGWRGRLDGRESPDGNAGANVYLACSTDGLEWEVETEPLLARPDSTTSWQPLQGQLHGLLHEPHDPDPEQRWKLIIRDRMRPPPSTEKARFSGSNVHIALYTSPDGRRWTWKQDTNLLRKHASFRRDTPLDGYPEGIGDVLQVRWDPVLGRYIAHTKHTVGPDPRFRMVLHGRETGPTSSWEARVAGWSESDDLVHWSPPRIYAYPDSEDTRQPGMYGIYEASGFRYESMWLGCLSMTANVPDPSCAAVPRHAGGYKRNWIRLAGSRDGRHWYYLADRSDFIPNGPDDGWDAHYLRMVEQATLGGPVVRGDEVWFYYHGQYGGIPGCPGLTQPKDKWESAIGVGICPRDRFVSLAAGDEAGEVITRPLAFTGEGALSLNGVTTAGGRIRAAVLDEAGEPLPGRGYDDCEALDGDRLRAAVAWSGGSLARHRGRYLRLAFRLRAAELFSFGIE